MITDRYYEVLYLLAACHKYEMISVQSVIRAKGLILETESAARQTLDYPLTYAVLGNGLDS